MTGNLFIVHFWYIPEQFFLYDPEKTSTLVARNLNVNETRQEASHIRIDSLHGHFVYCRCNDCRAFNFIRKNQPANSINVTGKVTILASFDSEEAFRFKGKPLFFAILYAFPCIRRVTWSTVSESRKQNRNRH